METSKLKNVYLFINISLISIFFILIIYSFFITNEWKEYYIGIISRSIFGIWCIFNGIWNIYKDNYSVLKDRRFQRNKKTPKWAWWLIFIVGVGCLITAFMGYGFNYVNKPM